MEVTNEQIKKALECCSKKKCGFECPYCDKNHPGVFHCTQKDKDALDYINRLETKIEQITKEIAKDILQIVREVQSGDNGMQYRNPDCVISSRIKEKYGIDE